MQGPSPEAVALLEELQGPNPDDAIASLEALGDPHVIPHLFWVTLGSSRELSATAARAVHHLAPAITASLYLQIDLALRSQEAALWSCGVSLGEIPRVQPGHVRRLGRSGAPSTVMLGLASSAANGYSREAAVRLLAERHTGEELPFLLIRLNDWVPQVREPAREAVEDRLTPDNAGALAACLPLLGRLAGCSRHDHAGVFARAEAVLRAPASWPALEEALAHRDRQVRRACVRLLASIPELSPLKWMPLAAADRDPMVRFVAASRGLARLDGDDLRQAHRICAADRSVRVRGAALEALAERFGPEASRDELMAALTHRGRAMRQAARHYLGRLEVDFAAVCRHRLGGNDDPTGALLCLAEVGTAADAALALPLLEHRLVRVRKAAVRVVGKLSPEENAPLFETLVQDDSLGVSRAAREVMARQIAHYPADRLWRVYSGCVVPHVRRNLRGLFLRHRRWPSLWLLLRVLDENRAENQEWALRHLRIWLDGFNSAFTAPARTERGEIEALLRRQRPALEEAGLLERLRFCIEQ